MTFNMTTLYVYRYQIVCVFFFSNEYTSLFCWIKFLFFFFVIEGCLFLFVYCIEFPKFSEFKPKLTISLIFKVFILKRVNGRKNFWSKENLKRKFANLFFVGHIRGFEYFFCLLNCQNDKIWLILEKIYY